MRRSKAASLLALRNGTVRSGRCSAARLDGRFHEGHQAVRREVRHVPQANPTYLLPMHLDRHSNSRLCLTAAPRHPGLDRTNESVVGLDGADELVTPRPHHRPAQFLQPRPGRLVALQPQQPHQPLRAASRLLGADPPHRLEPDPQRLAGPREDGPGGQGGLAAALRALDVMPLVRPPALMPTLRAAEAVRPSQARKILSAGRLCPEPLVELHESFGEIDQHRPGILPGGVT